MKQAALFALSIVLLGTAALLIEAWLVLLVISKGLMPWTAAGIFLYGSEVMEKSLLLGVPGVLLMYFLSRRATQRWRSLAASLVRTGTLGLAVGVAVCGAILMWEKVEARSRPGPCVSYRAPGVIDPATLPTPPDCPSDTSR